MKRNSRLVVLSTLLIAALVGLACAKGGGGKAAAPEMPPPEGSPLANVEISMNDTQVRQIMGEPNDANAYMTGKSWIPYYYGPDTTRTDWMYYGTGRVVFSRNRYSGGLKVIRVIYNPDEGPR